MKIEFSFYLLAILCTKCYGKTVSRQILTDGCTTPDGHPSQCLNIRQCPALLELLKTSWQNPRTVDFIKKSLCRYENKEAIVCCRSNQSDTASVAANGISSGSEDTCQPNTTPSVPSETSTITDNVGNDKVYKLPQPPDCGKSSVTQTGTLDGPAKLGAWPWVAALGYQDNSSDTTQWLCSGTLITARHVITAAHCAIMPISNLVKVRLGHVNLTDNSSDDIKPVDVNIEKKIIHPSYNLHRRLYDIAIIKLKTDVTFSTYIELICLPKTPELMRTSFVRNFGMFAGWGATDNGGSGSKTQLQLQMPVVGNDECQAAYGNITEIEAIHLCAGFIRGVKGTCRGDSGGPLMWLKRGAFYMIGVLSFGRGCALPNSPDVFSRVTSHLDWIEENIK